MSDERGRERTPWLELAIGGGGALLLALMGGYLLHDAFGDGEKRPAIVWITGGDNNSIGPVWGPPDPENDQGATGYRDAGIVMMFPSQRGGNHNPGRREGFLGEVDDVLAAAGWLRGRPHVDPDRVYLGGHSTGGTLAMLVAETDRAAEVFRAAFAFGPVADVRGYGGDFVYHTPEDDVAEAAVRGPGFWLESCRIPLWAIEGDGFIGNDVDLEDMAARPHPPNVHFVIVPGRDHFDVLHGANAAVADAILKDTGPSCDITLTAADLR